MPQENTLIKLVKEIADSKKISFNSVVDELKGALKMTYDKHLPETVVAFDFDIDNNTAAIYEIYEVIKDDVDEFDDYKQIQLADAKKFAPNAKVGDEVKKEIKFDSFDKTFIKDFLKNFRLNTATIVNKNMYEIWKDRKGTIINCEVESSANGIVLVRLEGNMLGEVSGHELVPKEVLQPGHFYDFYVKDVIEQSKGWPVILSRANVNVVIHAIKQEVVEVTDGTIKIEKIARSAGIKTKIAVSSSTPNVNPISTIIGAGGNRITSIRKRIGGEKIEVVLYNEDINKFILNVFAPIEINSYLIQPPKNSEERQNITIVVPNEAQSSTLGQSGSNARVCSDLLNAVIEIITPEEAADLAREFGYNFVKPDYIANPIIYRPAGGARFHGRSPQGGRRRPTPAPEVVAPSKWNDSLSKQEDYSNFGGNNGGDNE